MTTNNLASKAFVAGALSLTALGVAVIATKVSATYQANHGPSKAHAECTQFKNAAYPNNKSIRCFELRDQKLVALQRQFSDKTIRSWSY